MPAPRRSYALTAHRAEVLRLVVEEGLTHSEAVRRLEAADLVVERFGSPETALREVRQRPSPPGPDTTLERRREALCNNLPFRGRNQFMPRPETPSARLPSPEPGRGATPLMTTTEEGLMSYRQAHRTPGQRQTGGGAA